MNGASVFHVPNLSALTICVSLKRKSNVVLVRFENGLTRQEVIMENEHNGVQLWENGPYWATTNIVAERPEDYGYYFWWDLNPHADRQ